MLPHSSHLHVGLEVDYGQSVKIAQAGTNKYNSIKTIGSQETALRQPK